MTSEIRTNSLTSRAGLSTVTLTDSGPMFSGITTFVDNSGFNLGTGSSIFTPASNTLTFGTNSSERLRIGSSGQIGLSGANYGSSGQLLTSQGSGSAPTWTTVSGTTINNNPDNRIITGSGTANTLEGEANLTYGGGNLQFTTTANGQQVLLKSTGNYYNKLSFDSGNTSAGGSLAFIDFSWDGDKVADIFAVAGSDTTNKDDGHMVFRTSASQGAIAEALRITSTGNIGINQTSPQRILHIGTSGTAEANIRLQGGSDYAELRVKDSDNVFSIHTNIGGAGSVEKLKLAQSDATLNGTTDGVLNLNTTDSRGPFIRYQESGTTKCWVGSGQGMGLGDVDDLGLRATDKIRLWSNGAQRLIIDSIEIRH